MKTSAPDQRRRDLAKIHLAKKDLGLDRETYETMLWTIGRVRSAADLDDAGRRRVLDHLRARGFRPKRPRRAKPAGDRAALISKIQALLGDRPESYAEGILRQMFKAQAPARLEWATPDQLRKLVAALVYDQRRKDRRQRCE